MNIKEDVPEGPWVQSMPAETVHMQLCMFSQALQQAASLLFAEEASVSCVCVRACVWCVCVCVRECVYECLHACIINFSI